MTKFYLILYSNCRRKKPSDNKSDKVQDLKKKQDMNQNENEMKPMMSENESASEKSTNDKNLRVPDDETKAMGRKLESQNARSNRAHEKVLEDDEMMQMLHYRVF